MDFHPEFQTPAINYNKEHEFAIFRCNTGEFRGRVGCVIFGRVLDASLVYSLPDYITGPVAWFVLHTLPSDCLRHVLLFFSPEPITENQRPKPSRICISIDYLVYCEYLVMLVCHRLLSRLCNIDKQCWTPSLSSAPGILVRVSPTRRCQCQLRSLPPQR